MKRFKIIRISGIVIILSLLLMLVPTVPVFAAEYITLNPTQGKVNTSIGFSGGNYTASSEEWFIDIYITDQTVTVGNIVDSQITRYKKLIFGCDLDDDGTFSSSFTIPTTINEGTLGTSSPHTVVAGSYYICTSGRYQWSDPINPNKLIEAATILTVTANSTLDAPSPASGPPGTSVMLTGSNFPASTTLAVKFDTTTIAIDSGHTATLSTGLFLSYITIPSTATVGSHNITVTAGTETATQTFTVTTPATLGALDPASGPPNTPVPITGSNFPINTAIVFKFDSTTLIPSGNAQTGPSGSFASIITIPASATTGAHTITVTVGGVVKTATFTVTGATATPTLNALSPASGPPGTNVAISGSDFTASSAITVTFDTTTLTLSGSSQTDTNGSFSGVIVIPSAATAGAYTIKVTAGATSANATFTVTQSSPTPTTTPPSNNLPLDIVLGGDFAGAPVNIASSGFDPNSIVVISIDGANITQHNASESGLFFLNFTPPALEHGDHTIVISSLDGSKTASAVFTVESKSPDTPLPLLPTTGEAVSSPTSFDWSDVDDASKPVTYNLQIATSVDFSTDSIIINKTGILESQYTLTEDEQLKLSSEAVYYWRLQARDAARNTSDWISAGNGEFSMIKPFEFIGWPLYLTISLGGVALFLLGLWVGRRTAFYY